MSEYHKLLVLLNGRTIRAIVENNANEEVLREDLSYTGVIQSHHDGVWFSVQDANMGTIWFQSEDVIGLNLADDPIEIRVITGYDTPQITNHQVITPTKETRIAELIRQLLTELGEDVTREGLVDTPKRVARAWLEFITPPVNSNHTTAFEAVKCDEMVIIKDIHGMSYCEHHLLPFYFVAHVGYVTGDNVIGLSKVPRIVDMCAKRLQLQERLTNDIADTLERVIKPRGIAVVVTGRHTCCNFRGIKARESSMITSTMRGVMLLNPTARQEFLTLVNMKGAE